MGSLRAIRRSPRGEHQTASATSRSLGWLATLAMAATVVVLVIAGAWAQPAPFGAWSASQAVRADCANQVAAGIDTSMGACLSRASEAQVGTVGPFSRGAPLLLVLAVASGLLAGLVVLASASMIDGDRTGRRLSGPSRSPIAGRQDSLRAHR